MCNFKGFKGNLCFLTRISLKTKGNNYRCPTKSAENGHLHSERRAIQDILANSTDYLVAVALRPNFSSIAPMNRSSLAFP